MLKADKETVAIIRFGYNIPLDVMPPERGVTPNNKSCDRAPDFLWEEMVCYTSLGCIREVNRPNRVMLPLSVVFSNKTRLVVDGSRHLNPYVSMESTRLDSLDELEEMVQPGMFFAANDLDSGYWHVGLNPESYELCGCSVVDPKTGRRHFFQWVVLFLGVTSAVTVFTQVTLPLKST